MKVRKFTQQSLADEVGVSALTVSYWCWGDREPTERNFAKLCKALNVHPKILTAHPKELRDYARHKRVMDFYTAEALDENAPADYREVQLIEADIERTAELDPETDDTREEELTVSGAGSTPAHAEPNADDSDAVLGP